MTPSARHRTHSSSLLQPRALLAREKIDPGSRCASLSEIWFELHATGGHVGCGPGERTKAWLRAGQMATEGEQLLSLMHSKLRWTMKKYSKIVSRPDRTV